jgi:hypothetical protein
MIKGMSNPAGIIKKLVSLCVSGAILLGTVYARCPLGANGPECKPGGSGWDPSMLPEQPARGATLSTLASNVGGAEYRIIKVMLIVLVLAGLMMILKGLVHLKQQYTSGGGGHEKHLSKGIAYCVFGSLMYMVVPIVHLFTSTLDNNAGASWSVQTSAVNLSPSGS